MQELDQMLFTIGVIQDDLDQTRPDDAHPVRCFALGQDRHARGKLGLGASRRDFGRNRILEPAAQTELLNWARGCTTARGGKRLF